MRIFEVNEAAQKWETSTAEFLKDLTEGMVDSIQEGFGSDEYATKSKLIYDKLFQVFREIVDIDMKAPANDNL